MTRTAFIFLSSLAFVSTAASSQMVSNSAIQNDPAKQSICAQRANIKPVPFFIDQKYVDYILSIHPDTTFIAADGVIPELIECRITESTGQFEAEAMSSEVQMMSEQSYWHLARPKEYSPSIKTTAGQSKAIDVCMKAARDKANKDNFDHSFAWETDVNEITLDVAPWFRPGAMIAGTKADRYDVAVEGELFYKSTGPDLEAMRATCLLSPMLEVKSVETNGKPIHKITASITW
ncbi:MAG TPA: hypothetical protein VL986_07610 [Terracidiphilus sp.]|nr:hypothetical protein [Terracidiphilus sp.]